MKKSYVVLSAAVMAASAGLARAQSFTQDFESVPQGIGSVPPGWLISNQSVPIGDDTWGVWGAYNDVTPHGGAQQLAVRWLCGTGVATLSNWLVLPVVSLHNGDTFTFWTRMYHTTYPDRLQLRMSTHGVSTNTGVSEFDVGDFTTVLLDINPTYSPTGYPIVYTQYTAVVSGLPAETPGRFAFRYFVENGGPNGVNSEIVFIDDVSYTYTGTATTGACCLASGACTPNQTAAQCAAAGGVFQGLSTTCGSCPQPGACCFADGTCQTMTSSQCAIASGIFRGDNTTCSPNLCEQPGGCCLADGTCSSLLSAACAARTGVYRGAGSTCAAACPQPFNYETAHGDAGETLATAPVALGSGPLPGIVGGSIGTEDVDMYSINICDPANFRASTVTWTQGATGPMDSMLFLFRANGTGVAIDDDAVGEGGTTESTITNAGITAAGRYYLAISGWDRGPIGATTGGRIWATQAPQNSAPNGPGAAEPLGGWMNFGTDPTTGNPASTGFYTIAFHGACYVGQGCYPNCDSSTTSPCLNVLDFGCFLNKFAAGDSYANCDLSTTPPILNVLDFGCFLNKFAAGCSSC